MTGMKCKAGIVHIGDRVRARHTYGGTRIGYVTEFLPHKTDPQVRLRWPDQSKGLVFAISVVEILENTET